MINEERRTRRYAGFTLIEIVVAIAIVAVLTSVIVIVFVQYVEHSKRTTDINNAREVREAFDRTILDKDPGTYVVEGDGTSVVSWNKNTKISDTPHNLVESLLKQLGEVPVSVINADYTWCVEYNNKTCELERIYLTPTAGSKNIYELYPDYQKFLFGK